MSNSVIYALGEWGIIGFLVLYVLLLIRTKFPHKLLDYIIAFFIVIAVSETFKYIIGKPRPDGELYFVGKGFPSTHSSIAFFSMFFYIFVCHRLTLILKRGGKFFSEISMGERFNLVFIILLAITTGLLRVVIGAHDYFDVFAGIILGLIVAIIFMFYDIKGKRTI